jgi:hypothetical protein
MLDYHSIAVKQRMSQYLKSSDFDPYFERLHLSAAALWATSIIAPITAVGFPLAKSAWKKIRAGDARTKSLRSRYSRLAENGEVIFTYVVVANSTLQHAPGAAAPALVVGNFNDGRHDMRIMELRDRLADAALGLPGDPTEAELSNLLGNLDYTFKRRRPIPSRFTGGIDLIAFDLQIIGEYLPTRTLQIEAIPCLAERGETGLICMIPYFLIEDVMTEIERSLGKN